MFESIAVTGSSIHLIRAIASVFERRFEQGLPPIKARVFFKASPCVSEFGEKSELMERVSQLVNIAVLETSEADPFEVFDLRPLESRRVIVEVQERRPASFQFATEEDDLSSEGADPFEVFDLRPLESRRVIVEVQERRPASFQFATEEGGEGTR